MFCRNCGTPMEDQAGFCMSCGTIKNGGDRFCQNCGIETDPNASVCIKCGVFLKKSKGNFICDKYGDRYRLNWLITLILSIIFGYWGIDRFMMGHIGLGILKIITCGGCGLWYLIDIILIATKYHFKNVDWL